MCITNIELSKKEDYKDYLFYPFQMPLLVKKVILVDDISICAFNRKYITIDFNTAYNHYCAYNSQYSCPIVPLENDLDIAIEAGVKSFMIK
jgi:hypothetical protein